ncbi:MAG: hypothetical protein Q7K44_02050, partial [Candidatus Liptonbacteria bacterium]|nr:hypothetical protein [Candidatus Liptonbacteria bacterium]
LKTKEEVLYQELAAAKPRGLESEEVGNYSPAQAGQAAASLDPTEETLLSLIVKKPDLAQKINSEDKRFLSEQFCDLVEKLKPLAVPVGTRPVETEKEVPVAQLASSVEPALAMSLEFTYLKSQELWKDFKDTELETEFQKSVAQIKRRKISAQLANLEYDIKTAEKGGEKEKLAALVAEFSKISKELQ